MTHRLSDEDRLFREEFEACKYLPADFDHRAHVRLAYVYLTEHDADTAHEMMRSALLTFLGSLGEDRSKYHETMTRAWVLAVQHYMTRCSGCASSDLFIAKNPEMLDSSIMMTHYSAELLFSVEARARFVQPNLAPIPKHLE